MGLSIGNLFGVYTGGNSGISQFADPMDIFGNRAGMTADEIADQQQAASNASMSELQSTYDRIQQLYQPMEDAGAQGLAQLNSQKFTPSATYAASLAAGERDLGRKLRAMGRFKSTYGSRQMGDFYTRAAQEEADRQYAPALDLVQLGSGAVNAISGAGNNFGTASGSVLGNLATGAVDNAQQYGQARQASMNSLSSLFSGAAQYANSMPQGSQAAAGGSVPQYLNPNADVPAFNTNY